MKNILLLSLAVLITACLGGGGGGGGGGSSSSITGSATFENMTLTGPYDVCRNASAPSDQTTCENGNLNGTWTNLSTKITYATVDYDGSNYSHNCPGTTTSYEIVCRGNNQDFSADGGPITDVLNMTTSHESVCGSVGGLIQAKCMEDEVGTYYCKNYTTNTALSCADVGGTLDQEYSVSGDVSNANIVSGSNVIEAVADSVVLATDPQVPLVFSMTFEIQESSITFWKSTIPKNTGGVFDDSGMNPSFTVVSPVATSSGNFGSIVLGSASLTYK